MSALSGRLHRLTLPRITPGKWVVALLLIALLAACRAQGRPDAPPAVTAAPTTAPAATAPVATVAPMPTLPAAFSRAVVSDTVDASSDDAACTIATPCPEETPVTDPAETEAIDTLLATIYDGAPLRGAVLVARQGEVIARAGYGSADSAAGTANTPQTRFRLGSITKPITALAVLKLQAEGLVDVAAPVCAYLSECPAAWAEVTLHHLLSHTSGIPDYTRFPDFASTTHQAATPAELLARFADHPLDFAPGSGWDYSNSNYIVLGMVIEQETGQPYAAYLQEAIFAPLGMGSSGYDLMDGSTAPGYLPDGSAAANIHMSIPYAAGGLVSTVEDMAILVRALVEDELLSADLREQMWTAHAAIPGPGPAQGYGYGWIIEESPQGKVVGHNGSIEGFSAGLRYYLEPDVLIVVLSNEERRDPNRALDGVASIVLP